MYHKFHWICFSFFRVDSQWLAGVADAGVSSGLRMIGLSLGLHNSSVSIAWAKCILSIVVIIEALEASLSRRLAPHAVSVGADDENFELEH